MILVCYPTVTYPGHSYPVTLNPGQATLVIPRGTPDGVYKSVAGKQEVEYGVGVHPHCTASQGSTSPATYGIVAIFILVLLVVAVRVMRGSLKRTWGRDMRR